MKPFRFTRFTHSRTSWQSSRLRLYCSSEDKKTSWMVRSSLFLTERRLVALLLRSRLGLGRLRRLLGFRLLRSSFFLRSHVRGSFSTTSTDLWNCRALWYPEGEATQKCYTPTWGVNSCMEVIAQTTRAILWGFENLVKRKMLFINRLSRITFPQPAASRRCRVDVTARDTRFQPLGCWLHSFVHPRAVGRLDREEE